MILFCSIIYGNKNHKLINYPFIIDLIVIDNMLMKNDKRYAIAPTTADAIARDYFRDDIEKYQTRDGQMIRYGLVRHIVAKYDYKKCINIIMKDIWMGENIFGLENACMEYYQKTITDITNEELFSLLVLSRNPQMYKLNSDENIRKTKEIMDKYKLTK